MKQLLILSGKGGTGKTTVASAFIRLSKAKAYADCDVDAPNLHLIMAETSTPLRRDYYGLPKAEIDPRLCINCGKCLENCRFGAVGFDGTTHRIEPYYCEGCGVCEFVCPAEAVSMRPSVDGDLMLYKHSERVFSTAKLKMGSGTTGMLVSEVKKQLRGAADADLAIIDGSPGIGCPVIASLSGVDAVLMVTEPSISGISDLKRVVKTARIFDIDIAVCINKFDMNMENTAKIAELCSDEKISHVGNIPYDPLAVKAVNLGLSVVDIASPSGEAVREIYEKTMRMIFPDGRDEQ